MDIELLNSKVDVLFKDAVSIEKDEYAITGIKSWVCFSVKAESDLTLNLVVLSNGDIVACEGYGPHNALVNPKSVDSVFTENNFLYFISEAESFWSVCNVFECDNWTEPNCASHTNEAHGRTAWKLIEDNILNEFVS